MDLVSEDLLLDFYLDLLKDGRVPYVRDEAEKEALAGLLGELRASGEDLHRKITVAKKLWKTLFQAAMSYLDPDRRGYSDLFRYFDDFVDFEELLFASDSFYRDHTLHSLWVYFLQEYLVHDPRFAPVVGRFGGRRLSQGTAELFELLELSEFLRLTSRTWPTTRCVAALAHDLGYPVKKIGKINKAVAKMLPHFDIERHIEFEFRFSELQQHFLSKFLLLLSSSMSVHLSETEWSEEAVRRVTGESRKFQTLEDVLTYVRQLTREQRAELGRTLPASLHWRNSVDHHKYLRRCIQLEQSDHGLLSAYLLFKMLPAFSDYALTIQEHWHEGEDYRRFPALYALTAVADHSASTYQIRDIDSPSDLLTLVDELEEFSRITRASQSRQYANEFCRTALDHRDGWLEVSFVFDNPRLVDIRPEVFFRDKASRFLRLFDVPRLEPALKIRMSVLDRMRTEPTDYRLECERGHASIEVNGISQRIPDYLGSPDFLAEYAPLDT